ncbi:MAG: hypothetical protein PUF72_12210, partial [Clostridiales bacterium]|nr:hypothetical protein [Clostridiales bacterium]
MKVKRLLAALTAAVMALSMTVLPASAEETATEINLTGDKFSNTQAAEGAWRNSDMNNLPKPMSVIFNVAVEGYYNFQFRASDGSLGYLSDYDVELNGGSEFEKKESGALESAIYKVFDYGTVYLYAGLNQLTYTITDKRSDGSYLLYLDYAKFTKTTSVPSNTINLTYSDSAFSGGEVNLGDKFRYINGNEPGTIEATVSAKAAGWYKMSYEATAGDGSNVWLSKYLITLNDKNIDVPTNGTTTDHDMRAHEVAESVWLKEGNNTLVFNVNQKRTDGTYYFTIRSVTFTFVDKTNKINLPYSSFSGVGGTDKVDGYMIAYNNNATLRTMTATFNAEEAGVYSLRLVSTTGAPGADGKKDWHSDFEVKVNGVSINNFTKTANV